MLCLRLRPVSSLPDDSFQKNDFGSKEESMGLSQTAKLIHDSRKPDVEYAIYTFQKKEQNHTSEQWKMQDRMDDAQAAIQKAELFFNSGIYSRVEIKQRYFDHQTDHPADTTFRMLENKSRKNIAMIVRACIAAVFSALAVMVAAGLGQS